jgi:hypothetical protein
MSIHFALNSVAGLVGLLDPVTRPVAYLDPGTGSFLIQMVIAAVLGGAFLLRGYIVKGVKAIFKLFGRSEPQKDEDEE